MMVRPVDDRDVDRGALQASRREQAAEPGSDDDNTVTPCGSSVGQTQGSRIRSLPASGAPNCCILPPSRRPPRSTTKKPASSNSATTSDLAAASSPDRK